MIRYRIAKSEIANVLGVSFQGDEKEYSGIATLDQADDQFVLFIKQVKEEHTAILNQLKGCLIVTQGTTHSDHDYIRVDNTRLAMAKVLNYISGQLEAEEGNISVSTYIHPGAKIGKNVRIESFVFIDNNVVIGDYVRIRHGAKILKNTTIGDFSTIRENAVVGGQAFGVEKDEHGHNLKIAHLGGVIIGQHVELGAQSTITSGTINPTIVGDYVKISDHSHIPHNCIIGDNTLVAAGVILSGSVIIGSNVWIGPNSTVKNAITIGDDNFVGIATLITKNIFETHKTYAGVPGKDFDHFLGDREAVQFIVKNLDALKKILKENE